VYATPSKSSRRTSQYGGWRFFSRDEQQDLPRLLLDQTVKRRLAGSSRLGE
jgi:hypothetical protein